MKKESICPTAEDAERAEQDIRDMIPESSFEQRLVEIVRKTTQRFRDVRERIRQGDIATP